MRVRYLWLLLGLSLLGALVTTGETEAGVPPKSVVNSTADPGDGVCDAAECTLREAIADANSTPGPHDINFNIPTNDPGYDGTLYTIDVGDSQLTLTDDGTQMDATTQPGFTGTPIVRLRAHNATTAPVERSAIDILSAGNTVRGLLVNSSPSGPTLSFGIFVSAGTSNQIAGNWFGLNATGSATEQPALVSIELVDAGPGNMIGGKSAGDGNVICDGVGIVGGAGNFVQGNMIGVDRTGTVDLACQNGVFMAGGTEDNLIGGTSPAARNLLSGNAFGVLIGGGARANKVQGNYIGLDVTGKKAIPNFLDGVVIDPGATFNLIGGPEAGAGNVIAASRTSFADLLRANVYVAGDDNTIQNNLIGPNANCGIPTGATTYAEGLVLAGDRNRALGNVISANPGSGVLISNHRISPPVLWGEDNLLQGNIIGMDCSGKTALGNAQWGIHLVSAAARNVIGGAGAGEGNVIAGNGYADIELLFGMVADNVFKGNIVNLDANGSTVIGAFDRIGLREGAHNNSFGGKGPGDGNLIGCAGSFASVAVSGAGTIRNSFLGNSYRCTQFGPNIFGGYPIDLSSGGNTELAPPVLSNASPPRGTTCPGCQVEIVSHRGTSGSAVKGVVEGWTVADGSGNFELLVAPVGPRVFASTTDSAGNTSEFSAGLLAPTNTDRDGCTDEQENGPDETLGGGRDYLNFWDFFDVPTGTPLARDRRVTIGDIAAVVARFGSVGDAAIDPLSAPPAAPAYHTGYDRSAPPEGADPWDAGPPSGQVTVGDIALSVAQFGHTCAF